MGKRLPKHRINAKIIEALEATGLPWDVVESKRHLQVRIEGTFLGILPKAGANESGKGDRNILSNIKRYTEV